MDSPSVLARMNGAPPGADRSPAVSGERLSDWMAMSSSLFRVTCGTQHVISHEGPGQPPSLIPPFIQHMTVSVQLSHCPSALLIVVKRIKVMRKCNPLVEASSRVIIMDVPEQPVATRRRRRRDVNFLILR